MLQRHLKKLNAAQVKTWAAFLISSDDHDKAYLNLSAQMFSLEQNRCGS